MSAPEPGAPDPQTGPGAPRRLPWWLPHLITAAVAVAVSLGVQGALSTMRPAPPPTLALTPPTARPTLPPTPTPPAVPTQQPLAAGITSQELADLRAEDSKIWTAIYLSRAINQIAEAESAMRSNDLPTVDQSMIAVDDSLSLAYRRAADVQSDPIDQLRREASAIREDVYLRPEGLDARLNRLRQTILALIEERS